MSRTFFIGDIHGAHIALEQCLERSGFDRESDTLITAGDICDGWPYVYECVEILLTIVDTINLIGNHDAWLRVWLQTTVHPDYWWQGGKGTATSYLRLTGRENLITKRFGQRAYDTSLLPDDIPETHRNFFKNQQLYYKDYKNRVFVHAGFERKRTLRQQQAFYAPDFYWTRKLLTDAIEYHYDTGVRKRFSYKEKVSEVFIGHSSVGSETVLNALARAGALPKTMPTTPLNVCNVWNLDTGAGWSGKLTIMDIDTHEYWQSDLVTEIYGERSARG
jgi:serine/threonine protein phosphatase 1